MSVSDILNRWARLLWARESVLSSSTFSSHSCRCQPWAELVNSNIFHSVRVHHIGSEGFSNAEGLMSLWAHAFIQRSL